MGRSYTLSPNSKYCAFCKMDFGYIKNDKLNFCSTCGNKLIEVA